MNFRFRLNASPKCRPRVFARFFFLRSRMLAIAMAITPFMVFSPLGAQDFPLVPAPLELSVRAGEARFSMPNEISVVAPNDPRWRRHLDIFGEHLERLTRGGHRLATPQRSDAAMQVRRDPDLDAEAYQLEISEGQIKLSASTLKGLAHGTATLLQLVGSQSDGTLPPLSIQDAPRLSYRNFMIDMGRNPHSLSLLKEAIDLFWFYKIDSVQLHLTDDQRFAFPSAAFPKLWDGQITLDEFRELEAYAVDRGVTIIPELEVPGHSTILRNRYPDVFGENPEDLARTEPAFQGITTLLDELMDVFSSTPFVHIGGDEAFGVPENLQRELINRLHAYLKSKGKQTLVWEGPPPGEGDNRVHIDVIHINWRTINYPANRMLQDGYRVVNASWDPLYLVDHYPRTNFTMTSPQHIYETLSVSQFKHLNPGIPTFDQPIQTPPSERLIGFCMPWWEGREKNFFPQIVPRLIPFAEVAWNPRVPRDHAEFEQRSSRTEAVRRAAFYPVAIATSSLVIPSDGVFHDQTRVSLSTDSRLTSGAPVQIRYTLDGSAPTASSPPYQQPFFLEKSTTVRAALFQGDQPWGHGSRRNFTAVTPQNNLALGMPVTSSTTSGPPFSVARITDGGTDNLHFYLGYPAMPEPILLTIDLQKPQLIQRVVVHAYSISGSFERHTVEVSRDGKQFTEIGSQLEKPAEPTTAFRYEFTPRKARFVRVRSHGNRGYVFDSFSKVVEVQVF